MKKITLFAVLALLLPGIIFTACTKVLNPEISDIEVTNHDDGTKKVKRGGTISVNFKALSRSDSKLDYYHIEIHDHPVSGKVEDEYRIIDDSFKSKATFKGLVNASVHEHIPVPLNAVLGAYHVVITVVDEAGNSADTEEVDVHIEVIM